MIQWQCVNCGHFKANHHGGTVSEFRPTDDAGFCTKCECPSFVSMSHAQD